MQGDVRKTNINYQALIPSPGLNFVDPKLATWNCDAYSLEAASITGGSFRNAQLLLVHLHSPQWSFAKILVIIKGFRNNNIPICAITICNLIYQPFFLISCSKLFWFVWKGMKKSQQIFKREYSTSLTLSLRKACSTFRLSAF